MDFMTEADFDRNCDAIVTAVRLLATDSKRRKQSQLVAVYEKHTGELLVEVLRTGFGPVVGRPSRAEEGRAGAVGADLDAGPTVAA